MTPTTQQTTPATLSPRRELWLLITLAGIQFTHILDFMIMMPLGPQLTQLFGISDAQFGALVSAYTLSAGVSGLVAATYIDRFGRKRLLLVLYVLFGLATLACGLAPSYGALMVARILAGVFGGVLSALSHTIVADAVPFERRGRAMSIVMTSFSVSTVAGVPLGLLLATHLDWHAPFFGIAALCVVLAVAAAATMPVLDAHLRGQRSPASLEVFGSLRAVLRDPNHLRAFGFSALLMGTGFPVIPYITLFMQSNVGLRADQIPYLYLCGGIGTLLAARWIGRITDRAGKVRVFKAMAWLVLIPLVGLTLLQGAPWWLAFLVSTMFFVAMSGRMIPGMALLTAAARPELRGTFMTLNSSVQSGAMGLAALVGGSIISRDAQGLIQNYWVAALVGAAASLCSIALAQRLVVYGSEPVAAAAVP
jgi:predicted MFS family arabinose efflux permease